MGVYPVKCPFCSVEHMWFSGSMDQRCEACKNLVEKEVNMEDTCSEKDCKLCKDLDTKPKESNMQWQLIEALKVTISAKDDLIAHLRSEVERLKASQTPQLGSGPNQLPTASTLPFLQVSPTQKPAGHLPHPYIVTGTPASDSSSITITGEALPLGSIQSGIERALEPITTYI